MVHGLKIQTKYVIKSRINTHHPTPDKKSIEKYLASGLVPGIGPKLAKVLTNQFAEKVFHVIEQEPEKLTQTPE